MNRSLRTHLAKAMSLGTLALALGFATPATAHAQGFGVGVQFGAPYPVAFGPRYDDRFRYDAWRRHEEWVRQQEWRHGAWVRAHRVYGPYGVYGR